MNSSKCVIYYYSRRWWWWCLSVCPLMSNLLFWFRHITRAYLMVWKRFGNKIVTIAAATKNINVTVHYERKARAFCLFSPHMLEAWGGEIKVDGMIIKQRTQ
ncbi:uncharacterized protein Ecym_3377 [Eremothecium cymbalariae DBVPG|uniref:Uncharacterized protein n=1 Tax=Eremothecium cymbalariae (strain CBS 270.75 / DBVPG 7215 / KCTC 17166 / NRRL Y-17582) TaxID=931890 RepID=G8JRU5_ERECY|nr:Hypothetical protein Ecym_3377 [Eremothecium cymbalariae DBVPG\